MTMRSRLGKIPLLLFALYGVASLSGMEVAPDLRKIDPAVLFRDVPAGISRPQGTPGTGPASEAPLSVFIRLSSHHPDLPEQVRNLGGTARKILPRIYPFQLPLNPTPYL